MRKSVDARVRDLQACLQRRPLDKRVMRRLQAVKKEGRKA